MGMWGAAKKKKKKNVVDIVTNDASSKFNKSMDNSLKDILMPEKEPLIPSGGSASMKIPKSHMAPENEDEFGRAVRERRQHQQNFLDRANRPQFSPRGELASSSRDPVLGMEDYGLAVRRGLISEFKSAQGSGTKGLVSKTQRGLRHMSPIGRDRKAPTRGTGRAMGRIGRIMGRIGGMRVPGSSIRSRW
ncbi:hypothetical protein DRH14_05600 [Candidatus Shapirobacteria bacterium]|nr:MAG: hypothetical protein DRH14_05600 [Candidatus Shapirobacteria bacterium]